MFGDSFIVLILNVIRCSHCSNNKQRTETKVNIWWQPTDCVILLSPETEQINSLFRPLLQLL